MVECITTVTIDNGPGNIAVLPKAMEILVDMLLSLLCQPLMFPIPGGAAGYQILAPAYYDQNGQLVMGNGRGIGTPVRLVPPGPILVNAAAGQQGGAANGLGANTLRLLTTQQQQQPQQVQTPVAYTSASSTPQNTGMQEGEWGSHMGGGGGGGGGDLFA